MAKILLRKKSGHERAAATGVFAEEHGVSERTVRNWVRAATLERGRRGARDARRELRDDEHYPEANRRARAEAAAW